jgi:hypothetical protein
MMPPLVTNIDREWAMKQCPIWARRDKIREDDELGGEIVDDGGWLDDKRSSNDRDVPNWDLFVIEQIERFEKFFADWSNLWRLSWWPKANPERRFPMSAPKKFYPFFRKGSPEFARALAVAKPMERHLWEQFGVAQFDPSDPRLPKVIGTKRPEVNNITPRITGEIHE